jgi:D-alanine-D-alanine ligase
MTATGRLLKAMNIAIITGGDSSEFVISMKSAEQVSNWLQKAGHNCYTVVVTGAEWLVHQGKRQFPLDRNSFGFKGTGGPVSFDFAWNIIHGTPGEDGKLQGYLDMMGIPYNCSNHLSSALTFNKFTCKTFLKQHQVLTPEARLVKKGMETNLEELAENVGFPCFVKPNSGGSSFGISRVVKFEHLQEAINEALKEDREAIVERFIRGTEVTCGLMKTAEGFTIFPVTEIIPKNEFFDYEAKYTEGKAEEITPARIDEALAQKCQNLAARIYDLTDSSGIIRVDFIIKGNQLYFLELNSIPGMSPESIIPKQVSSMGREMEEVLQEVIDESLRKK